MNTALYLPVASVKKIAKNLKIYHDISIATTMHSPGNAGNNISPRVIKQA
jgi:hypothetical protein